MKKFVKKTLLYLIPITFYLLCCEYFLFKDNELRSVNEVANAQLHSKTEKYYFRKFFDNSPALYKLTMATQKKADILVVGQSTVLQFRGVMFHPFESNFYNMGPSMTSINELYNLINFIKSKKIKKPKLMIIGLDLSLVKKTNNNLSADIAPLHEDEIFQAKYHAAAAQSLIKFYYQNGFSSSPSKTDLGFGYLGSKGTGYRNDGSLHYAQDIANYLKKPVFCDAINYKLLLKNKEYIFTNPFNVDARLVQKFIVALTQLKQMNVQTLVFFPPVSNDFSSCFSKNEDFSRCFRQYLGIQDTLKKHDFDYIPFSTPKKLGLPDNYMLDGIHPSEVLVGILLRNYLTQNKLEGLLAQVDSLNLRKLIFSKNAIPLSFMTDSAVFSAIKQN